MLFLRGRYVLVRFWHRPDIPSSVAVLIDHGFQYIESVLSADFIVFQGVPGSEQLLHTLRCCVKTWCMICAETRWI